MASSSEDNTSADLQETILRLVDERGTLDSWDYSIECCKDHQMVVGAIKSLESLGEVRTEHTPDRLYGSSAASATVTSGLRARLCVKQ